MQEVLKGVLKGAKISEKVKTKHRYRKIVLRET
jgi:hypothetical protein